MVEITKDLLEVIVKHLTDRLALAILFASSVCALLMLIPGELGVWMRTHWIVIVLSFLLSACYLPTRILIDRFSELSAETKRNRRLENLTKAEKEVLAPYIQNDYRTRRLYYSEPVPLVLAHDGVLLALDKNNNGYVAYSIQDWARSYLMKHPDALRGAPNVPHWGDS